MIKIFDGILTWIGQLLGWIGNFTGSYMLALLVFSVAVEIIFLPFDIKQQKNQIKQAKLRPKDMAIRNKYKGRDDNVTRQKMQMEIQEFYQQENYNPMSGCLPLLIQLPVIMALYSIVINPLKYVVGCSTAQIEQIIETIKNVKPDVAKLTTSQTIPVIEQIKNIGTEAFSGIEGLPSLENLPNFNVFGDFNLALVPSEQGFGWLIIIPILVFAFQFASTKLMRKFTYQAPAAQDANMGCSNSMMDITMPLMTTFFAYTLPGAIGIYWISKNILSTLKRFLLSVTMPMPKCTEEDIKEAEKALKAKAPKKSASNNGVSASGRYVRSLHHIDDEDFEDTKERAERAKAAEEAEKKVQEEKANKNSKLAAPLKEDKNDSEENK